MNTRLGKSFGLAFVVAVGILAVMFALGTFSSPMVGAAVEAGSVELSLDDQNPGAHTRVAVSFTEDAPVAAGSLAITFAGLVLDQTPANYGSTAVAIIGPLSPTEDFNYIFGVGGVAVAGTVLTLTIPADLDPVAPGNQIFIAGEYTVVVRVGDDTTGRITTSATALEATATVDSQTSEGVPIHDAGVLSSQDAGAGVSLRIDFPITDPINTGDDVVIELEGFQVPSIDADAVSIRGVVGDDGGTPIPTLIYGSANAADVTVDGTTITVEIPDMDGTGNDDDLVAGDVTIRIRSRAGVENPTTAGDGYPIVVTHSTGILYDRNPGYINATLAVDPTSGVEGEELTVSGVGYSNGTATIYHTGGVTPPAAGSGGSAPGAFTKIGSATVSGGSFSMSVAAGDDFNADGNDITARGSTGVWGPTATFTVNGAISIAESVTKGTDLAIEVSKWSAGDITGATINGEDMNTIDANGNEETSFTRQTIDVDGAAEFKIRVGNGALLGEQTLVLYVGDESAGQKNIEVVGIDLTVSPSTAVVGHEVTVTGSGFVVGGTITTLSIGGVDVLPQIAATDRGVASGGRVVAAFIIPDDADLADADDYSISLGDGTRTGSAMVTIPERTLMVSPSESRIGSTIDLSGSGWPTGTVANLVGIYYGDIQLSTATTDSSGEWSASITVPGTADVGKTNTVEAKASVGATDNVTVEADHQTPAPVVNVSPAQAQRGTTVTVSGDNFHTFRSVAINIGGSDVTPSATTTDGDGSFSVDVLVPGLSLGNKNLKVTVNEVPVVEFLEIVSTPVSTSMASADAFASLITAGNLTVVWNFDNATKAWSFYDPRPAVAGAVDLNEVSSGDNVWIRVTADQMFQGDMLTAGWNLVTLD